MTCALPKRKQIEQERVQLEGAIRREIDRAAWLARLPDENPSPVVRVAANGIVLYHNPAAAELPEWACAVDQPLPEPLLDLVIRAMAQGQEVQQDVQLGGRYYLVSFMPIPDEAYANLYGRDITDRKQAEQALQDSETRYRRLIENANEGIWTIDADHRTDFINQRGAQILGYTVEEMLSKPALDFVFPEDLSNSAQRLADRKQGIGDINDIRMRHREGHAVWVSSSSTPILGANGEYLGALAMFIDITERRQAEQTLRESEEKYRKFFDHLYETVSILEAVRDEQGEITDWIYLDVNRASLQILGLPVDQVVGRPVGQVLGADILTRYMAVYSRVLETGEPSYHETTYQERTFLVSISRMDENRVASIGLDISERKQVEEAVAEFSRKVELSNRELEQFAFAASHDLQEPLRKIEVFGDRLLESATQLDDRGRKYVERMRNAAGRMRNMVDGLLQLSRVTTQGQPFIPVDLSRIAADVLSDLEYQIQRSGGRVEINDLFVVEGDPLQLHQLLQNLIGNALKYHRLDTPPVVTIRARRLPGSVQISVVDNGIGFDPNQTEQMFQPFQRLVGSNDYEGSGIGLAICRRIVERHGGEITARGEPGMGSTFVVTLPAKEGMVEEG